MKLEMLFNHSYDVKILPELTNGSKVYYYPGASHNGGRDGIMLGIMPDEGPSWVGIFAFGEMAQNGFSGAFSTPDPGQLCVVANGTGYFVSASDPDIWSEINVVPVIDVRSVPGHSIILFANYTNIYAFASNTVKWKTPRLSWDGMKILELKNDIIKGEYYDLPSGEDRIFEVDLASGVSKGGLES